MKSDKRSTCPRGEEQYEPYYSDISKSFYVQYDYRTPDGTLFSCVAKDLDICRRRKEEWLEKGEVK